MSGWQLSEKRGVADVTKRGVADVTKKGVANVRMAIVIQSIDNMRMWRSAEVYVHWWDHLFVMSMLIGSSFMTIWCSVSLHPCFNTNIIIETKYLVKLFLLKTILMRLLELFSLKSEENEDLVRGCLLVEEPPFGQDASELRGGGPP